MIWAIMAHIIFYIYKYLNISELIHIKYPIIQGGMGNISNAAITVAELEAGCIGRLDAVP